jgi:ribonucleoside-diphosphate reductase beta chain
MMVHRAAFQSTSARGLKKSSPPMRLWQKAKKLGIWDPCDIDLAQDRRDWLRLAAPEQDILLRLTSQFQAGEEAVTLDLLPLISIMAAEGRLEEEIYLTSFLWEEAKHVEAFSRFFDEIVQTRVDTSHFHGPNYRRLFYEELPGALGRLRHDTSPAAQARASVTYNLIVEGVMAETGYHAYFEVLRTGGLMPGMQQIVDHLKRDESRHLAYGVYLLSRLVAEHGDPVWNAIEEQMQELMPLTLAIIDDVFSAYPVVPFELNRDDFLAYAMTQFQNRFTRIEKAREQTIEEILEGNAIEEASA